MEPVKKAKKGNSSLCYCTPKYIEKNMSKVVGIIIYILINMGLFATCARYAVRLFLSSKCYIALDAAIPLLCMIIFPTNSMTGVSSSMFISSAKPNYACISVNNMFKPSA